MQGRKSLIRLMSVVIVITALVAKLPIASGNPPHQSDLQVITTENVARLTQLERWGRGFVMDAAFSPDNQILAIQSTVGIWLYLPDGPYNQEPRLLENEHGGVSSMLFHPVENTLVVGNRDGTLSFWDVATGIELKTIEAHRNAVALLAFTPDGTVLATADTWDFDEESGLEVTGKIKLWDWATGDLIYRVLSNHHYAEYLSPVQFAFTSDGTVFVAYFTNHCSDASHESIEFFDVQTGQPIEGIALNYPENWTNAITFDHNGTTVLLSDFLGYPIGHPTIMEWDESRQDQLNQIIGNANAETTFDIIGSSDGKHLLFDFSGNRDLVIWDFEENQFQAKIPAQSYSDAIFSPDGQKLVLTTVSGFTYYDLSNRHVREYDGFPVFASKLLISADGTKLGALNAKTIRIWNTENWREIASRAVIGVADFDFSPDGKRVLFGDEEGHLSIWDINRDIITKFPSNHDFGSESVLSVAFNPDLTSERIFASGSESEIFYWKQISDSGYELDERDSDVPAFDLAISPEGKFIAAAGLCDGVFVHEVNYVTYGGLSTISPEFILDWAVPKTPSRPISSSGEVTTPITTVVFKPDSSVIATGAGSSFYCYRSGNVQLWSVPDLSLLATLEDHTEEINAVVFNPDGSSLASSSEDGTILVRRSDTYEILAILEGHLGYGVNSIAFTPDGRLLISAGDDGTIRLWGIAE